MKRIIIALFLIVVTLGAKDLYGMIGMGLGFSPDVYQESGEYGFGFPIIDIAVTKIGMSPTMAIEPIGQFTLASDGGTEVHFLLSVLGDFLLKGHSKTNIYAKAGLGFVINTGDPETMFGFNLPFGFGLEHFVSDQFSINLSALSGFTYISNSNNQSGSNLEFKLGNEKPFAFYLLWYY